MNHTFVKALRAVLVAALLLVISTTAMADGDTQTGVRVNGSVYGGGNLAPVGGSVIVSIEQEEAQIAGDVYGGGAKANTNNYDPDGYEEVTGLTAGVSVVTGLYTVSGDPSSLIETANQKAAENTKYYRKGIWVSTATNKTTTVTLTKGTVGGDVYGGGYGLDGVAANVYGAITVTVEGGTARDVFGCNNLNGAPQSTVAVNINGTSTNGVRNVYGGGNAAAYTGNPVVTMSDGKAANVFGGGLGSTAGVTGDASVTISGGTVTSNVYGGGSEANLTGDVAVSITGGTVTGDVYGGGAKAHTNTVNWDATANSNAGGWATGGTSTDTDGNITTTKKTIVSLTGGIVGNAYGGGLGDLGSTNSEDDDTPAYVYGDVIVTVNGTAFTKLTETAGSEIVPKTGRVFGCNNLKGTPKGSVTVTVIQTKGLDSNGAVTDDRPTLNSGVYELQAVYGGGNQAPYVPANSNNQKTKVEVQGCNNSIEYVYGGGNSASVPETDVTIRGAYEIDCVFGGGNGSDKIKNVSGDWIASPGANVTGDTNTALYGGTIHSVFGGSNTKGTIEGSTNLVVPSITDETGCPLKITDVYGAGRNADVDNDVIIEIGCLADGIENVYGGAYNANINGKVQLTITSGVLQNVFGGNNSGGTIKGPITVNIEETDNCKPIKITNLYGAGNAADYPSLGNTVSVTNPSVTVNVKACTSIDNIYGGGCDADVYGNTEVNINMVKGWWAGKNYPSTATEAIPNTIGTIGNVYGGGQNGKVYYSNSTDKTHGNATVNIGTESTVGFVTEPIQYRPSTAPDTELTKNSTTGLYDITVEGAKIVGDVYGGGEGNATTIDGTAQVNLGAAGISYTPEVTGNIYGGSAFGTVNVAQVNLVKGEVNKSSDTDTATGNVFGGGKGQNASGSGESAVPQYVAHVTGSATVILNNATVQNAIYGGCNTNGVVGTSETAANAESVTVTLKGGTVGSSSATDMSALQTVFGGGLGSNTHTYGTTTVNVGVETDDNTIIYGNVYGGSKNGSVSAAVVDLKAGTIHGNVYGGGYETDANTTYVTRATDAATTVDVTVEGAKFEVTYDTDGTTPKIGQVFGCNNAAGSPTGHVKLEVKSIGTITDQSVDLAAVYGGGNLAAYTPAANTTDKNLEVVINANGAKIGKVFGGGNAANVGSTGEGGVAAGTQVTLTNGEIKAGVYGGCNTEGTVTANTSVTLSGGTVGASDAVAEVCGGGLGKDTKVTNSATPCTSYVYVGTATTPGDASTYTGGTTLYGDIYGGSAYGEVDNTEVNLFALANNNPFGYNVFGGGKGNYVSEGHADNIEAKVNGTAKVNMYALTIAGTDDAAAVYGGCNVNGTAHAAIVNLIAGTIGTSGTEANKVFGGGKGHETTTTTATVNVGKATTTTGENPTITYSGTSNLYSNVYGGSALGDVTTATVNLNKASTLAGDVFGGGMGCLADNTTTPAIVAQIAKVTTPTVSLPLNADVNLVITGSGTTAFGGNIYGGCNINGEVSGKATINLLGGSVPGDVYGGGKGNSTSFTNTGSIEVNVGKEVEEVLTGTTSISGDVYGGSEQGTVNTAIVNLNKATSLNGSVFGGGKGTNSLTATSNGTATVNLNSSMTGLKGIYGGANVNGLVKGAIDVNINANAGSSTATIDIFGGGYGQATNTEGNVTVTIGDMAGNKTPVIYGDIYGGSALGNVNNEATDLTKVDFLNGTLKKTTINQVVKGGNIYGGGLGDKAGETGHSDVAAKVNGQVQINIGSGSQTDDQCKIDLRDANIYGCNNTNGSPQDNVTVNIYRTAHNYSDYTEGDKYKATYTEAVNNEEPDYAINQVFGGGNHANYAPENGLATSTKKAMVKIIGCENTISRVFGGGNAAAAVGVATEIDGGRFDYVYGGGNGEVTAANIGAGGTNLQIHGGKIINLFGGSNNSGTISGSMVVNVDNSGCNTNMYVDEFFCGNNAASIGTEDHPVNVTATIACGTRFGAVYGGCNLAPLYGNVNLTIEGGVMDYVYGGSKGDLASLATTADPSHSDQPANIFGDVTLTVKGGQIKNVFGGSNINGNITGSIEVNIEKDDASNCNDGWYIGNVYGASNLAAYTPTKEGNTLKVNIKNGTVNGNVYGGGKGETAIVTSNPVVTIGDVTNDGYVAIVADKEGDKDVTNNDLVGGNVYGGGDAAAVVGNTKVIYNDNNENTSVENIFGGGNQADVTNTTVEINAGHVEGNVYGGGNLGDVGAIVKNTTDYNYKWTNDANPGDNYTYNNTGLCTVTISGGTIGSVSGNSDANHGNVFGAGKGKDDSFYCEKGMVYKTNVTISKGTVYGNVYGGGQLGRVENNTVVTIEGTNDNDTEIRGDVFGAGAGVATHGYSALVRGDATVIVQGKAKVVESVYGGGETASVGRFRVENSLPKEPLSGGTCSVTIQGDAEIGTGSAGGDVYGACKGVTPADYSSATHVINTGESKGFTDEDSYLAFLRTLALTSNTNVTIGGNASVNGSVYGGGQRGISLGSVRVNMSGGTVNKDVYGGAALADTNTGNWNTDYGTVTGLTAGTSVVTGYYTRSGAGTTSDPYRYTEITTDNQTAVDGTTYYSQNSWSHAVKKSALYTTTVSLTGGIIKGDAYGGGLGDANTPAYVYGDVLVDLNGTAFKETDGNYSGTPIDATAMGCVVNRVFGANNVNGSPKGEVVVYVHATQPAGKNTISKSDKTTNSYDVLAVYGGGNLAEYWPVAAKANGEGETDDEHIYTNVIIDGCGLTSINRVFGGGNAASTPSTRVTVNGSYEINEVFGGGNGEDGSSAHVGFHRYNDDTDKNANMYGFGKAEVIIGAGVINNVYGASNADGNVRQVAIATLDHQIDDCELKVEKAYGGGKQAPIDGRAILNLGCVDLVDEVYGGAEEADVHNDIELNITNGTYDRVFGGNNISGEINGTITINIEETGCTPIIIGQLFGGGNKADYVTPAGKTGPTINVKSFTSIGEIYGGGFSANINGDTYVNINEVVGDKAIAYEEKTIKINEGKTDEYSVKIPAHTAGKIGSIGYVYGGGYGADVIGDAHVNIGTEPTVKFITGTKIGQDQEVVGVDIIHDVFGGGYGAATTVTGDVIVNIGGEKTDGTFVGDGVSIGGSVYGGSALGAVNATRSGSSLSLTEGKTTAVTLKKGSVTGAVFGGGQGSASNNTEAHVYGDASVTLYGDVIAGGLYGGCDDYGKMHKNAELYLYGGKVGTAFTSTPSLLPNIVFGGGKGEKTTVEGIVNVNVGTETKPGNVEIYGNVYGGSENGSIGVANVNLYGGTIWGNVFGGGYSTADGKTAATNVNVTLDGTKFACLYSGTGDDAIPQTGQIFGCNNLKGSPTGHVKVWVKRTVDSTKDGTAAVSARTTYDVAAVYGGGNKANYVPATNEAKPYTEVLIEGCELTSIDAVYGGGNAAAVPATNVTVNGSYIINRLYGGGNGAGAGNPGADVIGKAITKLNGGYINSVYGGSNTKGDIGGGTDVQTKKQNEAAPVGSCPKLIIGNLYGAGSHADVEGDVNIILECMPEDYVAAVYGGAEEATIKGNVKLTVTSGKFGRVFGGNNLGGSINGSITVYVKEEGCKDLEIGELFGAGNQAPYSKYGCYLDNTDNKWKAYSGKSTANNNFEVTFDENEKYPYPVRVFVEACTSIGRIFGGGLGSTAEVTGDTYVNVNMMYGVVNGVEKTTLGHIGQVFGGGKLANVKGNTLIDIGTETAASGQDNGALITKTIGEVGSEDYNKTKYLNPDENSYISLNGAVYGGGMNAEVEGNTTINIGTANQNLGTMIDGNVYGGGMEGDVTGNTQVVICAKEVGTESSKVWQSVMPSANGVTITGNVFGGGQGIADSFTCEKAMVGVNNAGLTDTSDGGTTVIIGNGTVNGTVYGGGEIGRVEKNTKVTIGLGDGVDETKETPTSAPEIKGNVFGGGQGEKHHGYAGLVRGNPTVTIQGNAKVRKSVYGGGEIASVARYKVAETPTEAADHGVEVGMPYVLANANSGYCTVTVKGFAEIGPKDEMKMYHEGEDASLDKPDDLGHVFGAGKGVLPEVYTYAAGDQPYRIDNNNNEEYYTKEEDYFAFIQTLALSTQTNVTIDGNAFVKGSVYGGSENGLVQFNTAVTINNGQIGAGKGVNRRYTTDEWDLESLAECASWVYGLDTNGDGKKDLFAPYDPNANATGNLDEYPLVTGQSKAKSTEGGRRIATDGHTYYGNVFGGGSGSIPYFDTPKGISRYIMTAGQVRGKTSVTINGGHILTNVYGGCEATNVLGKATVKMTGGSIGVPRTYDQIIEHPVTCYLFGAGKGDQRIFFNKDTNVDSVEVEVTGGRIYGSVFGGGEDGHVMRDVKVTIGQKGGNGPKIGTLGSTYVDGNVFGGGRGFGGEALTAGNVGGTIDLIINGGEMLGSVYGGGRLASVGYGLYLVDEEVGGVKPYGVMRPDNVDDKGNTVENFKRGYITVTVNGGTIGKEFADDAEGEHSGNVFGGSMGRLTKLDGSSFDNTHWPLLATAKKTTVNINGGIIKRSVYGGGEMGTVTTNATVNVSGGTIGTLGKGGAEFGNVYGGGKGYVDDAGTYATAGIIKGNTKVTINSGSNDEPKIYHNIYGGGAYGSVGTITYDAATYIPNQTAAVSNMPTAWERAAEGTTQVNTGTAEVYVYGGTIGTNGNENGMVFGSSRGDVGTPVNGIDPNNRLAWVYNTKVVIGGEGKSPIVYGSVYGSGENGHVFENTQVDIHSGTMGVTTDDSFGGPNYRLRGNVYGGGCGEDTYPGTTGTKKEDFNPLAGIVLGTTNVMIDGGQVVHNVYGAGALGSATNTSVTIAGNAVIGVSGKNGGNVFGAARGKEGITIVGSNLANSIETAVNINGGQIWGSVYGGGETGNVKQDVNVSMTGGAVAKDVYGGGALAHTQTANWDMTNASWLTDKISTTPNGKTTTTYKTHVSLTGGTITGDAYGGALGRKAVDGIAAVGTEGQDGYTPAVPAITAVEAMVYGDVLVELNGKTTVSNGSTSTTIVGDNAKGCIVNRVFGCNNLNGTPKGKVKVYVYATQKNGESDIVTKAVKNTNTYDVQAVYGGGNLAVYEPVDATLEYNDANKARVDAAYPEVVIDGCKVTSIKQVYGGGNAASVPATFVEIRRCYEIDEVFGGGNGFDNYSVEERGQTVWHQNPGANVGYYDYTHTETSGTKPGTEANPYYLAVEDTEYAGGADHKEARLAAKNIQYGSGIARLEVKGGTIHTSYGGSNSKGNVRAKLSSAYSAMFDDCEMQVAQSYGGGKNAYSDAETDMVADCAKGVKEMFGGAKDADMDGDINMLITNGSSLERVFGGNNTSGAVNGSITITLKEGGCEPIKIGELYAGGFLAPYSVYGYKKTNGVYDTEEVEYIDTDGTTKTRAQRIPLESGTRLYKDPRINVISATSIGNIFGGGYQAKLVGNPHINVNMTTGFVKVTKTLKAGTTDEYIYKDVADNTYAAEKVSEVSSDPSDPEAKSYIATTDLGTIGNIYGGGNMADIVGDTYVEIGTGKWVKLEKDSDGKVTEVEETLDRNGAKITGNVFGGGKGKADTFLCEKAMIGKDGDGVNNPDGGTHVTIGNGTVDGNVYGGGEIGRVEKNTVVTIGLADAGSDKSKPVIKGSVFGGGKGEEEHGYAALVRGNPTVIIQADAKVEHNVYGGGEIASVARYNVPRTEEEVEAARVQGYDAHLGMPYALANTTSGNCHVTVKDNAIIGPDTPMKMYHPEITDGSDVPDDAGHVFGAGKGILPQNYTYVDKEHKPKRMVLRDETIHTDAKKGTDWDYVDPNDINNKNVWEYFADRDAYIIFIQTLALSSYANVTIGDDTSKPFVKGSVYGGSENGLVQFDTKVYIKSGQIGCGKNATAPYGDDVWVDGYVPTDDLECASWEYGLDTNNDGKKDLFAPYDPNANASENLDQYPGGISTEGGRRIASDGHTYYGNVFGGGSGSVPYFDTTEGISKYLNSAGTVKGDTYVEISGGHILTNVYGGCEATNVLGTAKVTMTGGTLGVPRTPQQIKDHPVTCYLFGAGKGDQRIYFNKETNVNDAIVNVEGGRIYGSVFGGGEDGHVLRNTTVTIGKTDGTGPKIGTVGSTYVDGNVFGGGRGFGGEALTAGNVGGSVDLIINGGTMLGSVYGGGRLASVGYGLYLVNEEVGGVKPYGKMREDNEYDGSYPDPSPEAASAFYTKGRGHITVNINGGTIGSDVEDEHSGNVFGGSMGRLTKIDGSPFDDSDHWSLLATAKTTEVKIAGGTIKRNVYGGGEMGTVIEKATVNISGGTIGKAGSDNVEIGNVFGGGKGYLDPAQTYVGAGIVKGNTNVAIQNGTSGSTTTTPTIYQNVYGGGELGYVGMFTTPDHKEYTWTENTGLCTVEVAGGMITGHVFGAGKGHDDTFECERAMVRTTSVDVSDGTVGGNVYGGGEVGRVDQNSAVTIGPATGDSAPTITGSVFGAGAGVETHGYSALVRGNTAVVVQGNAKVGNSVYGGGQIAAVGRYGLDGSGMPSTLVSGGECVVTVQGNAVIGANGIGNVFGAGMGVDESKKTYTYADNANRPKRMMTFASGLYTDANKALWEFSDATHTYVWEYFDTKTKYLNFLQTLALATDTRLTINGNASVKGSVYGGSESGFVQRDTEVKILGGEILTVKDAAGNITEGNVFGGGKGISDNDAAGRVRSDTRITVLDGTINGDVYGGGALGKANTLSATNTTIVNLLGGTINGDVYGGGLGNATTAADVGNTKVNLNGMTTEELNSFSGDFKTLLTTTLTGLKEFTKKGAVVKGNVFGANNVNGTPKGHVLVHVHGTQNENTAAINAKVDGKYDVLGVYGGGNQSDYVPTDTKQSTEVIIEGCDLTSIDEVYGGGYGAATPATSVLVKGTKIINNVYGGGYGASTDTYTNPGANVGYRSNKALYDQGTGMAIVQLMAGTINNVYGGSNTLGDIRGGSSVTNVANDGSDGCCEKLTVGEIYGGGKQADMYGGAEIVLGCMPNDWIGAIYGGAENADIGGDVGLTLTSGKFERVFGGNKSGGKIDGYIEVNIEENPECSTPIIIGGLYGGGNEAPYTYPLLDKDPNYLSPRVNVRAFTSIGNIYGGGFGATATVTGNPLVNINVVEGGREYAGEDKPLEDGTTVTLHARSKDAKMGVIGNVFGGGNAAKVIGNPRVEVGTAAKQKMLSLQTKDAAGTVHEVEKDVLGADIRGNVYGGGNNATVTGDPKVIIGQRKD